MLNIEDGYTLIRLARDSITSHLTNNGFRIDDRVKSRYSEKRGVFVTLNKIQELRGCIGYPLPIKPLYEAIIDASINACRDPRFEPVSIDEIDKITVELSILSKPEIIRVKDLRDYPKMIKVGRDGLLIYWRYGSGLLLPQVAVEYGWDTETFLCETCRKAGALPDCWLYDDTKIFRFEAIIFEEKSPMGEVIQH